MRDDELQRLRDARLVRERGAPGPRVRRERGRRHVARGERRVRRFRQQLGGAQRGVEPLAGERIVEARRVPREQHAAHARLSHSIRQRPHRHHRPLGLHAGQPRRHVAELPQPRLHEGLESGAVRLRVRQRHHQAHVDDARRDRVQDGVVGRVHVDLAAVVQPLDAADVLDEGQPPPPVRPHEPERAGHHGGAAVGAHHQPAAQLHRRALGVLRLHAPHEAALHDQPRHAMPLAHVHRQRPRPLQQDAIEDLAPDRERVVAVAAPPAAGRIRAVEHGAVGRHDAHAVERLRAGRVHRLQHAQAIEHARGLGREVLPADLRARERGLVEQGDRPPALGQQDRGRAARGTAADDDDIRHELSIMARGSRPARHDLARTAQKRKYGR